MLYDMPNLENVPPSLPIFDDPWKSRWQRTLENILPAVTKVRFCRTISYDTEAGGSEGTGFVIDAELGYLY